MDLHALRTPYVIVGAVATWLYMPQRVTRDLDLLVDAADAPALHDELSALGCAPVGALSVGGSIWRTPDGGELDLLELDESWVSAAIQQPNRSPSGLPVISLPYLVLMKLRSSRAQDVADLSRMLGQADEATLEQVRSVVATLGPADLTDLESLITLGRLEFETP